MTQINTALITKLIKNNEQNIEIKLNTDPTFEQSVDFKTFNRSEPDEVENTNLPITSNSSNSSNSSNNEIIYIENGIINIPKNLNDIFNDLISDDYYLFGVSKTNSFLMSLLYIISTDFKYKKENKNPFVELLIENLIKNLPEYFKQNKYSSMDFSRTKMMEQLKQNEIDKAIIYYISDYYNINLIVLNYNKMTYITGKDYKEDNKNVIIINNYNDYIPLLHIYGECPSNLIYKSIINKLEIQSKLDDAQVTPTPNGQAGSSIKLKLKAITSYKLKDLQTMALSRNINIKLENTNKNKTKKQLYDDLVV
jgi:hypothetical protein